MIFSIFISDDFSIISFFASIFSFSFFFSSTFFKLLLTFSSFKIFSAGFILLILAVLYLEYFLLLLFLCFLIISIEARYETSSFITNFGINSLTSGTELKNSKIGIKLYNSLSLSSSNQVVIGIPFSLFKLKAIGVLSIIIISFKSLPNFAKSLIKIVLTNEQCSLNNL